VARQLQGGRLPLVVYVTAYEKHALEAFETGAVDYLLKPVRRERLQAAMEKVKSQLAGLKPAAAPKKIVGRQGTDLHLLDPAEVVAFQAEGDVVYIFTSGGRYYCDLSLRALEEKLPAPPFRRIHRGTIINTEHIRRISPLTSKRWMLKMSNGMETVVSKRLAGVIRDAMNW
jgi:DNA-binding LytR/AlgR family response regulator